MNKFKFIEKNIQKYKIKLGIKESIKVRPDGRWLRKVMGAYKEPNNYLIKYSPKKTNRVSKNYLILVILHELGHIKLRHFEELAKGIFDMERWEYEAEKFSINLVKKYIPKYYEKAVEELKDYFNIENEVYRKAFTRLYKELKNEKV